MSPSQEDQVLPITLYPSRLKSILLLLICLAFTAMGIVLVRSGDWVGYLCGGFFGLACIAFVANMLPGASYLRLHQDGFTFCSLYRAHTESWSSIKDVGVLTMRRHGLRVMKMVAWNFQPQYVSRVKLRRANQWVSGFDAALPDTYGRKAEQLAVLMESLRAKAAADSSPQAGAPEA